MPSSIPRRSQNQPTSITSENDQKLKRTSGSSLVERAGDSMAEALSRRKSAVQNKIPRRQTIGYSGPKTPVIPRVLKRKSMAPTVIRVSPRRNKGQNTSLRFTTTSHREVGSKSLGYQKNLRPRRCSNMLKVSPDGSSEADITNSDPINPNYWTWDEAEENYYHINKTTNEKLWYEPPT